MIELLHGDCMDALALHDDSSVDSVVTDPPYGLKFMGKKWDYDVPSVAIWREVLRVLRPGGYFLSFGGTRTYHRMVVAIEDAGFEIRDQLQWLYGSGFPKSQNISKVIDRAAGAERMVVGKVAFPRSNVNATAALGGSFQKSPDETISATPEAKQWDGFGTALKPANEPIVLARKPLGEKTVAANVLKWGVGGLNIDGCRIETVEKLRAGNRKLGDGVKFGVCKPSTPYVQNPQGRFPANVLLDSEAAKMLDEPSDRVSRFFYCAKASKRERGKGNSHPTVKPVNLMRYLVRLVTPPNGVVLDPFMGSGTTGLAAIREDFGFLGIEMERESFETSKLRIDAESFLT